MTTLEQRINVRADATSRLSSLLAADTGGGTTTPLEPGRPSSAFDVLLDQQRSIGASRPDRPRSEVRIGRDDSNDRRDDPGARRSDDRASNASRESSVDRPRVERPEPTGVERRSDHDDDDVASGRDDDTATKGTDDAAKREESRAEESDADRTQAEIDAQTVALAGALVSESLRTADGAATAEESDGVDAIEVAVGELPIEEVAADETPVDAGVIESDVDAIERTTEPIAQLVDRPIDDEATVSLGAGDDVTQRVGTDDAEGNATAASQAGETADVVLTIADETTADGDESSDADAGVAADGEPPEAAPSPSANDAGAAGDTDQQSPGSGPMADGAADTTIAATSPAAERVGVTTTQTTPDGRRVDGAGVLQQPRSSDAAAAAAAVTAPQAAEFDGEVWEQVQKAVNLVRQSGPGNHEVNLVLRPEELGSVSVELVQRGQEVAVRIITQTTAAQDSLDRDRLLSELQSAGIDPSSVDISHRDPGRSEGGRGDDNDRGGASGSSRSTGDLETAARPVRRSGVRLGPSGGGLDLAL